jgi:hypothetical protein
MKYIKGLDGQIVLPNQSIISYLLLQSIELALFLSWMYFNQNNGVVEFLEWKPLAFI